MKTKETKMPTTNVVEEPEERYQFSWSGKRNAICMANAPATDILLPVREESVDFDNTKNLYIEGDNLEVLKLLRQDYLGKIGMIYIDPPYNTGNDFVYNDDLTHVDWLNMMYPRLMVAKDLLNENGAIFISIDHHELVNLVEICDELYGMNNRIGIISVINNMKGRSDDAFFATCNEFLVVYAKSRRSLSIKGFALGEEELDDDYDQQDETGHYKLIGYRKTGNAWKREERPHMYYPVLYKDGVFSTASEDELNRIYDAKTRLFDDDFADKLTTAYNSKGYQVFWPLSEKGEKGRWRWGIETFYQQKDTNLGMNKAGTLCTKMRATLEDGSIRMKSAKTLWYKPEYDTGSSARLLASLLGKAGLFQNPKSLSYLKDILTIATDRDSIILDFFSGSATTAHAVMQLNADDDGKRQFIMVQLPEPVSEKSEAYKADYKNICEIGKARIREAGKRIKSEHRKAKNTDTGFRVLRLDSTSS